MNIFAATVKGPLKIPGYLDPDDTTHVEVFWGAPTFTTATVYHVGDVVRPTVDNGYYYTCSVSGVSGGSEPSWGQTAITTGTAQFTPVSYDLYVLPAESITASTWEATESVTLVNPTFSTTKTGVTISPLPVGVAEFILTNQITKSNGESLSRSFKYKVNEQ